MIRFLWKGIVRDRSRSLLPIAVVTLGVLFVVFLDGLVGGMMNNMINMSANFETGHLKVVTRAYNEDMDQKPNDLALLDVNTFIDMLNEELPSIEWTPRISFGGLLDIPNDIGETRAQGPVVGTAYDLLNPNSKEAQRIGLEKAVAIGSTITKPGQILVSYDFAERFDVQPGSTVTFFGSTMYGSMSFANYTVAGVARFGTSVLDRGAIILDISDARLLLDMDNAASEVFGFMPEYDINKAESIKSAFNAKYKGNSDEYAPMMLQLADQNSMRSTIAYVSSIMLIMVVLLVFALSIVLWNTGVLGGIRRYNEFGVRLALGEEKKHIYGGLLGESLIIGIIGSCLGTALGLAISFYVKTYGIDYGSVMDNISMMIDPVIRSDIKPRMYYIGFIPGVISMLIGSALAGIAIYRRKTAVLFKELG